MASRKIFSKFFAKFSQVFRKFSQVFWRFWTCSDLLGPARKRSDAFGCIWMRSDASGRFRKNFGKFDPKISFCNFRCVLEDLKENWAQNQLLHQILLQMQLFWRLCGPKLWKNASYPASASPIATSGAWCVYWGGGVDMVLVLRGLGLTNIRW